MSALPHHPPGHKTSSTAENISLVSSFPFFIISKGYYFTVKCFNNFFNGGSAKAAC